MTRNDVIDAEIRKLRDEKARLWSSDCGTRDVQIVALDAMMKALQWSKDPKPASDRYYTPFDEYCFLWQNPEPVMVPTPDPSDYDGTPLEGFAPQG